MKSLRNGIHSMIDGIQNDILIQKATGGGLEDTWDKFNIDFRTQAL